MNLNVSISCIWLYQYPLVISCRLSSLIDLPDEAEAGLLGTVCSEEVDAGIETVRGCVSKSEVHSSRQALYSASSIVTELPLLSILK